MRRSLQRNMISFADVNSASSLMERDLIVCSAGENCAVESFKKCQINKEKQIRRMAGHFIHDWRLPNRKVRKKNMEIKIQTPLEEETVNRLKAGDYIYISGTIYTARDAAHKRMFEAMGKGENPPLDLKNNIIYYLGPSPAKEGQVIGSAGPTTSSRMDKYTPLLLDNGLKGMIGKGKRSESVIESMKKNKAVYFAAVGGAGALLSKCIQSSEVIAYDDLGTEAIRKLEVENLPVIVVIDKEGNNLYETAVEEFKK